MWTAIGVLLGLCIALVVFVINRGSSGSVANPWALALVSLSLAFLVVRGLDCPITDLFDGRTQGDLSERKDKKMEARLPSEFMTTRRVDDRSTTSIVLDKNLDMGSEFEPPEEKGALGGTVECSIMDPLCPLGYKCTPRHDDVSRAHCTLVSDFPNRRGRSCVATPSGDDCDSDLICWELNGSGHGKCFEICSGTMSAPWCSQGYVCWNVVAEVPYCIRRCHPLRDPCPHGEICIPHTGDFFACSEDKTGEGGRMGDSCEFLDSCDPGLICMPGGPDCMGAGCCARFCDIWAGGCGAGQRCQAFYDKGSPGYENLGVCALEKL